MSDGQSRFRFKEKEIFHFAGVSSFSNFTVIPEGAVLKIPKDIPFELAALIGCSVITGVGSVMNAADVSSDSSIAVFGAGGGGVNVIQGAVLAGAKEIIAIDQFDSRLEQAKAFGATKLINSKIKLQKRKRIYLEDSRYYVEDVRKDVIDKYGYDKVYKQGFNIKTPLDLELQKIATQSLRNGLQEFDKRKGWRGPLSVSYTHLTLPTRTLV